jgi:RNA polymerase sigma-70 factor (ECF subfamily)
MAEYVKIQELVTAAQAGDSHAFTELVQRYYTMVHGLAFSQVQDWDAAEDVSQEAFLLAWTNLANLKQPGAFTVWLRRIVRSAAVNWVRNDQYRRKVSGPMARRLREGPAPAPDPAVATARQECLDEIGEGLGALPPMFREAIVLYYLEGNSMTECASALGIPVETMKKRLNAGRARLQAGYERRGAPRLEPLLPYAPQPFAQRVLAGLAFGPAVPHVGNWTSGWTPRLCLHHLWHGGSLRTLQEIGLIAWSPVQVGAALTAVVCVLAGSGAFVSHAFWGTPSAKSAAYYEGVGIIETPQWDDPTYGNYIRVERVFPGYPSHTAGVRDGDRIVKINGVPVTREYWADPAHRVTGPAGSKIRLTVIRSQPDGTEKQFEFEVTRGYVPQAIYDQAKAELAAQRQSAQQSTP